MPKKSKSEPVVMISSTVLDLPAHRKEVLDACLRQTTAPKMQEHLPAAGSDAAGGAEAVRVSLAMIDEAEIYVGVFAHRYGYVPAGQDISITEMEYNRAVERCITRLIFLMHDDHPVRAADVETGPGAEKLKRLKERLRAENVVNFFRSPEDLRAHVINSLSRYRAQQDKRPDKRDAAAFPRVGAVPAPPEPYIAHVYALLQTRDLVGRRQELNLLTDWVSRPGAESHRARVLNVVALTGAGKSALVWKWFNDVAPREMSPLAGRMWWNFYESDGRFKNFVTRALAYVTGRGREDIEQRTKPAERENLLLAVLDSEPFLFVLDGLERLFNGYTRPDAARPQGGAPGGARAGDDAWSCKTTDPRVGSFLRKLSSVRASRILVTSRLEPADLQTDAGVAAPGALIYPMGGLSDADALRFWDELKQRGSREKLLDFFHAFGNLPLFIQTLSGLVARHRRAPGDFDDWHRGHPTPYDPALGERMRELLSTALDDLEGPVKRVLLTIAAFYLYAPVPYVTLVGLLAGGGEKSRRRGLSDDDSEELRGALAELQGRGLLGWNRDTNSYSLHPAIRGTVWCELTGDVRREIYEKLLEYFRPRCREKCCPEMDEKCRREVSRLEDLTDEMEHFNALIKLEQYEKAGRVFMRSLDKQLAYCLGYHRRRAELLRMFFADGLDAPPRHKRPGGQTFILGTIATAYLLCGQYRLAAGLYWMELERLFDAETRAPGSKKQGIIIALRKRGVSVGQTGQLRAAEGAFRMALLECRTLNQRFLDAVCWQWIGILHATRGDIGSARAILGHAEAILSCLRRRHQSLGLIYAFLAQCELWRGDPDAAQGLIDRALGLPELKARDLVRVKRLQGAAELALGARLVGEGRADEAEARLRAAEENLNFALHRAREVRHVREELQSLIGLAELEWRRHSPGAARALLADVAELAADGPDTLSHADACILLAQVERGEGNLAAAATAAKEAHRLAWCDGPPYAYHWGLEKARALLKELGEDEPPMPAFDESKHEPLHPLPDLQIDPADVPGAGG